MNEILLEVWKRETIGKKVKALRRDGKTPAILYGTGMEPIPITLDSRIAERTLSGVTSSSLVTVKVDGNQFNTLVRDRQRDVITGAILHIDFQVVSLTEMVRAEVSVQVEGEAPAVIEMDGILVIGLETIDVEGLPQDLPSRILVDISVLETIGNSITVGDIAVPANVTILNDLKEVVVSVTGRDLEDLPEEEEEEEVLDMEEPEIIGRGRREGEDEEEAEED